VGGDSLWFSTRSALFREGEEGWSAAAEYLEPLSRLLARRYRWIPEADREDIASETVLEIRRALAAAHDPERGKFRALLQSVIARRVADRARRRRPAPLAAEDEAALAAPPEEAEVEALEVETALVAAVREARDRLTQGRGKDQDALYALVDRVVHGRTDGEIAARERVSADAVARRLARARAEVMAALLRREAGIEDGTPAASLAVDAFTECLRRPREEAAVIERLPAAARPEAIAALLARLRAALPRLARAAGEGPSATGEELRRGLEWALGAGGPPGAAGVAS
jgi:DNA-directed RNA polymerase specialized sigma24 family protein